MAAVVNVGFLKEVRWSNPDAGAGKFYSKEGETHTLDPGGLRNADDEENLDSSGTFIMEKGMKPWCYEAVIVVSEANAFRQELEKFTALAASNNATNWIFVSISGVAYTASGCIVGDIKVDRMKGTISFKAMGGGNLSGGTTQFATQLA